MRKNNIGNAATAIKPTSRHTIHSPQFAGEGARATLNYFNRLIHQLLVILVVPGELERIRQHGFAFFYAGDHVRAAEPVSLGVVGLRPLRGVVRMGMVEADNILFALAGFTLDVHQFFRIDVVAVLRRVGAGVTGTGKRSDHASAVLLEPPEQHAAALVRIGLFTVLAKSVVMGLAKVK